MQNVLNLETLELFSLRSHVKGNKDTMNLRKLYPDKLVSLLIRSFYDSTTVSPMSYLDCYLLTHVLPLKK